MTPLDAARLSYQLHSDVLVRCLGDGGAAVDLPRARIELAATMAALLLLTGELAKATP